MINHVIVFAMEVIDDEYKLCEGLEVFVGFAKSAIEHVCLLSQLIWIPLMI